MSACSPELICQSCGNPFLRRSAIHPTVCATCFNLDTFSAVKDDGQDGQPPIDFPANAAVSSPSPILHGQRRVRTADLPFAGIPSMPNDKQRIDATVERAVAEILLQLPSIPPERLKEFATICVKEGMRLGIREAQMTIAEGLQV